MIKIRKYFIIDENICKRKTIISYKTFSLKKLVFMGKTTITIFEKKKYINVKALNFQNILKCDVILT